MFSKIMYFSNKIFDVCEIGYLILFIKLFFINNLFFM